MSPTHSRRLRLALVSALILTFVLAPSQAPASAPNGTERLLVKFRSSATDYAADRDLARLNARQLRTVRPLGVHVVSVPGARSNDALRQLRHNPRVAYAERDLTRRPTDTTPDDPLFPIGATWGGEWGSFLTEAPRAWDLTVGSSQVVIADVDSGVASAHPDFAGQLVGGYNAMTGTTDTSDTYGHGTWVGGVIAATANNGVGIAGYCWRCRLMPVKVYSSSSGAYDSDIARGITWAVDHGARVVNISLAGPGTSTTLANAVAYARQHGTVVVAAAGNNSCNCPQYPAAYSSVVSVAASDQSDALYSYSNYGSWVDVAAPGQNVTTMLTDPRTRVAYGYGPVGGTSLATPVVAGIAGLLFSLNPSATGSAVESALATGSDPVVGANQVANGRVNAYKALAALGGVPPPPPPPLPPPLPPPPPPPPPPPATQMLTFSGSLSSKNPARNFSVSVGAGLAQARLSFSKCTSLALGLSNGPSAKGSSVLALNASLASGAYTYTVSGGRCSFTLTVSSPSP
jgi:thermitase